MQRLREILSLFPNHQTDSSQAHQLSYALQNGILSTSTSYEDCCLYLSSLEELQTQHRFDRSLATDLASTFYTLIKIDFFRQPFLILKKLRGLRSSFLDSHPITLYLANSLFHCLRKVSRSTQRRYVREIESICSPFLLDPRFASVLATSLNYIYDSSHLSRQLDILTKMRNLYKDHPSSHLCCGILRDILSHQISISRGQQRKLLTAERDSISLPPISHNLEEGE